ncbi:MAG: hypothetical protein ABSE36_19345 [Terracidiphilus sp.]
MIETTSNVGDLAGVGAEAFNWADDGVARVIDAVAARSKKPAGDFKEGIKWAAITETIPF